MHKRTILDTILEHKRDEVASRQHAVPFAEIKARAADQPTARDFVAALQPIEGRPIALIAEVKKASPSAGIIREDFDPIDIALAYDSAGAACLSVLTDESFFQGQDKYLQDIREFVQLPILRKDFTVDSYQIYEARALGADAILLIASALSRDQIEEYSAIAHDLGMAALVEVHTRPELDDALYIDSRLIGINSRNLATFVTDLGIVEELGKLVGPGVTLVAESGIKTPADVERVRNARADAILVGETLMRQPDIGLAVRELLGG